MPAPDRMTSAALRAEVAAIREDMAAISYVLRLIEARLCRITLMAEDVQLLEDPRYEIVWEES